jgi:uncharacterized membrane protein
MSLLRNPLTFLTDPVWPWSVPYVGLLPLLGVALLLVFLTVWTYIGVAGATRLRVLRLVLLRLAALALAFLALLRPSFGFRDALHVPSTLFLVVDHSESMSIQDAFDGQSRWSALQRTLRDCEPILKQLHDEHNVEVKSIAFAGDVVDLTPDSKPDGKRTDFGEMLQTLYDRHRADPHLRGLIVLSDGADNGTRHAPLPLAAAWRSLPCPIHTVAFGKPTTSDKQSDINLVAINPEPASVPIKGELTVKGTIDALGFENAKVRVQVLFDDQEVAAKDETLLLTTGNEVKVKCTAPAKPGEIKVTLRVQPLPGEVSEANNAISTFVTVTKEGVSVLLVDKLRSWEPQAICDVLRGEPNIRLYTVWLQGNQPLKAGQLDLFQFARQHYDVIILGDVSADRLREGNADTLKTIYQMVNEKGTGLLMMGGFDSFGPSWHNTPIEKLLPVELEATANQVEGSVKMVPTERGLAHYLLRLDDRAAENKKVWDNLWTLNGYTRLGPTKKGATVLAAVGDAQTGAPLLVGQQYGEGRTLAFGGDTTNKWKQDPEGVHHHARFWKQIVLWLAKQEEAEGHVLVKPDTRRLAWGSKFGFSMHLRGKGGNDVPEAHFEAKVLDPQGGETPVLSVRDQNEDRGTFLKTDEPGEYRVVVKGEGKDADGQPVSGEATARFLVYRDDAETARRAADHDFLKKLAATGGGQFLRPEDLARFLKELQNQPLPQSKPHQAVWPDWKRSTLSSFLVVFFLLFVAVLSLEWFLRRRWGLV